MSTAEEETATARQANSIAPAREDTTNTSPQQTAGEEHQDAQPPSTMVVDSGAVVVNNKQEGETAAAAVDDDGDSIAKEKEEALNLAFQETIAKGQQHALQWVRARQSFPYCPTWSMCSRRRLVACDGAGCRGTTCLARPLSRRRVVR